MEVKVIFRDGFIRDVSPPSGVRISVYDYDVEKYHNNRIEKDPEGEPCVGTIYFKYPYDEYGKQVHVFRYEAVLAVIKGKVRILECPEELKIEIIDESTTKKNKK